MTRFRFCPWLTVLGRLISSNFGPGRGGEEAVARIGSVGFTGLDARNSRIRLFARLLGGGRGSSSEGSVSGAAAFPFPLLSTSGVLNEAANGRFFALVAPVTVDELASRDMAFPFPLSSTFDAEDDATNGRFAALAVFGAGGPVFTGAADANLGVGRRVMTTSGMRPLNGPGVASLTLPNLIRSGMAGTANSAFRGERSFEVDACDGPGRVLGPASGATDFLRMLTRRVGGRMGGDAGSDTPNKSASGVPPPTEDD